MSSSSRSLFIRVLQPLGNIAGGEITDSADFIRVSRDICGIVRANPLRTGIFGIIGVGNDDSVSTRNAAYIVSTAGNVT
ncbi:hypothetical protein Q5O14_02245 [Eubacteriaceae bacterium ES2]|nr:hypothetical protein Q5O14_02245 [Eubacteriaceae bacterium ES2]